MKRIATVACMLLGLIVVQTTGLKAQSAQALTLNYPDFSNVSFIAMNGATEQANGALRLTPAAPSQAGSAYYSDRQVDLTQPIHTSFSFYLHDTTTPVPADGITFTLQAQSLSALGGAGGGLGYAGISGSVAVSFDTFVSASNPGGNTVGIDENGTTTPVAAAAPSFSLYGAVTYAWVDYDPGTNVLQVFVSRSNVKPSTPLLTQTINLATVVGAAAWAGFTGGTGTDDQFNDIDSWTLSAASVPIEISTVQLTPGVVNIGGTCYVVPSYTYSPTCSVTPIPASAGTRPLIFPLKTLSVSAPNLIGGLVEDRTVTVTSSVACFSADEPIDLYTLGNPDASALRPLFPATIAVQPKNHYRFSVDPGSHTAVFSLETVDSAIDATGLGVKAVWPEENIERIDTIIAPATATPLPTPVPGGATSTPGATATSSAVGSPVAAPTTTPAPAPPSAFILRTCVTPNPIAASGSGTVFAQTEPGAVCTASVQFNDGTTPVGFDASSQTALSDGFVLFPFTASATATSGIANVVCAYDGQTLNSVSSFLIGAAGLLTGPGAASLPVSVSVSPTAVHAGQEVTIAASAPPASYCVAAVAQVGTTTLPFNGYAQLVPPSGQISWGFQAQGAGQTTATVVCALGAETGQSSGSFTVSG